MLTIRRNWLLVLIFLIAFLLRFIGTNPGYSRYHSDEPIIYGTAIDMVKSGSLDPKRFDYPATAAFINFLAFKYFFIPVSWVKFYVNNIFNIVDGTVHIPISPLEADRLMHTIILGEREVNPMFWARYVTALLSFGSVVLTYLVGKKLFAKRVGLIAAILLTFDFKHVVNSHIGLPDIYNAFFLLLAIWMTVKLWKSPTCKNYLLTGIAVGLSIAAKYQFLAVFSLLLVHLYLSFENKRKINFRKLFNPYFIVCLLAIPLTFAILNPYFFTHLEDALSWIQGVSLKYSVGTNKINLFPFSYMYHINNGPIEFAVIIFSVFYSFFKFPKKSLLLLFPLLFFVYFFCYYSRGGFYIRNLISVMPLFLIFAAILLDRIFSLVKNKVIIFVIIVLVLFIPARNSIINSYYYTKPWNYGVLSDWMFKNLPVGSIVAAHPFDPPTGTPEIKKTEFEIGGAYSLAEHRENGASYALLNLDWGGDSFYYWMSIELNDIKSHWSKPLGEMRSSFYGIASEEIFRYQIFSVIKPWQAPDADLILAKLPDWPKVPMVDTDLDNIKSGHLYNISADIYSSKEILANGRDGYLEADFCGEKSVSNRFYGKSGTTKKVEIIGRVLDGCKILKMKLKAMGDKSIFTLTNLKIKESKEEVEDITAKAPYIKKEIDLNDLYPNSHGNL